MKTKRASASWIVGVVIAISASLPARGSAGITPPAGMALVGPGVAPSLDSPGRAEKHVVKRFLLDRRPVTNGEFLAFVDAHPEWRRDAVPRLFADPGYLMHWEQPALLGDSADPEAPVVNVSWFAAKAFCEARGARLPTEDEWELAAAAPEAGAAANPEAQRKAILAWYARPTPAKLPHAGSGRPNALGIQDLHGLVWEWVQDFNSWSIADGRRPDEAFVCGGTSLRGDRRDYATFMRFSFRASLRGHYTTKNLGFRCAADVKEKSS